MGKPLVAAFSLILLASPAGAYGPSNTDWVDETTDTSADCPACPGSYVLNAVHGRSRPNLNNAVPNDLWAVGDAGLIVKFNGTNWAPVTSGTSVNLHDVYINADGTGWAVGDGGTVLYLNSSGNWVCSAPGQCPNGACAAGQGGALRTCSDLYDIFPAEPYGNSTTLFIVGGTECGPPEGTYGSIPTVLYWSGTQWRKLTYDGAGCGALTFHSVPIGAGDCQPYGVSAGGSAFDCNVADIYTGGMIKYNQGAIFGFAADSFSPSYWPYFYNSTSHLWKRSTFGFVDSPCPTPKPSEWTSVVIGNFLIGAGDAEDCKSWAVAGKVNNMFYMDASGSNYLPIDTGLTPASALLGTIRRMDYLPLWGFGIGVGWGPIPPTASPTMDPAMYTAAKTDAYFVHFQNPDPNQVPNTGINKVTYWQKPPAKSWGRLNGVFIDSYNDAWAVGNNTILHWVGPIVDPAVLEASFTSTRTGMKLTLVMSVTNTGESAVKDLNPIGLATAFFPAGLTGVNLVSAPTTIAALPPGGPAFFTWTYSLTGFGSNFIRFTGTATGWDLIHSGPPDNNGTLFVAASIDEYIPLSSAMAVTSARKCDGTYMMSVTMTVTNTGTLTADNVTVIDPAISDQFAGRISGPSPAAVYASLAPAAATTFSWTYTISALPITVTGYVSDAYLTVTDEHVWSAARTTSALVSPSLISTTMMVTAVQTKPGEYAFNVEMQVFNHGTNDLNPVTATSTQTGAPWGSLMSGPSPASFSPLIPNWPETFHWTYTATSIPATFSGQVSGVDSVTGLPACADDTASVTSANTTLSTSITTRTIQMGSNQYYLVVDVTVTNTGIENMSNFTVSADDLTFSAGLTTSRWTGPALTDSPSSTGYFGTLTPGQGKTFEWTYSFTGNPVNAGISGTVNGIIDSSGLTASQDFGAFIAPPQSPMSTAVSTRTHKIGKNQYHFVVEMTVTNTGGFPLSNITVGDYLYFGGGTSTKFAGPTSLTGPCATMYCGAPLVLNQGTTFQWTYTFTGTIPSQIYGTVTGRIAAWGIDIFKSFLGSTSPPESTCLDSALSITAKEERTSLASRWKLTVVMTVSTTGACSTSTYCADAMAYKYLDVTPAGQAWYLSGPTPDWHNAICGTMGKSFTWTYSATGSATFSLTGSAMGLVNIFPTLPTAYGGVEDFPDYTEATASITTEDTGEPGTIRLDRNLFPSSNTKLSITFNIKEDDPEATLVIYNSISQKIRVLHDGLAPRRVDITYKWDGRNDNGDRVASGVYYVRLETNRYVTTRKVVLIK